MVENDFVRFWKEGEILFSDLKKPLNLEVDNCKEIIDLRHQISDNQCQYWCMDYSNLKTANKGSYEYVEKYGQEYVHALAVVVDTFLTKFNVELFMRVKQPRVPMKIFSNRESAVKWLLDLKSNKSNCF